MSFKEDFNMGITIIVPIVWSFFVFPLLIIWMLTLAGIENQIILGVASFVSIYVGGFGLIKVFDYFFAKKHGHEQWFINRRSHKVIVRGGYDSWLWCSRCHMVEDELDQTQCPK